MCIYSTHMSHYGISYENRLKKRQILPSSSPAILNAMILASRIQQGDCKFGSASPKHILMRLLLRSSSRSV